MSSYGVWTDARKRLHYGKDLRLRKWKEPTQKAKREGQTGFMDSIELSRVVGEAKSSAVKPYLDDLELEHRP